MDVAPWRYTWIGLEWDGNLWVGWGTDHQYFSAVFFNNKFSCISQLYCILLAPTLLIGWGSGRVMFSATELCELLKMHFSKVFFSCIPELYFSAVFNNPISWLYFSTIFLTPDAKPCRDLCDSTSSFQDQSKDCRTIISSPNWKCLNFTKLPLTFSSEAVDQICSFPKMLKSRHNIEKFYLLQKLKSLKSQKNFLWSTFSENHKTNADTQNTNMYSIYKMLHHHQHHHGQHHHGQHHHVQHHHVQHHQDNDQELDFVIDAICTGGSNSIYDHFTKQGYNILACLQNKSKKTFYFQIASNVVSV